MSITIHPAIPADAPALVAAQIAAFHHDAVLYPGVPADGPPGYDSLAEMHTKIETAACYKLEHSGTIIGGAIVYPHPNNTCHVDVIFITPAYQNRGLGAQLMTFLENAHPSATRWTLDTPQYATRNHHFYEKLGYQRTAAFTAPDGFALYAYEKIISS